MKKSISVAILMMGLCSVVGIKFAVAGISTQHSDAEVLGVLSVIDQNEIQAAQLAEQKSLGSEVFDYVRMLDIDHNKHLDKTRELSQRLGIPIADNSFLDQFRDKGEQDLAALTVLDAGDFARLYIVDLISEYSEALNWIAAQDAQNEQVKNFLKKTQKSIALHLERAQKIETLQENR